MKNDTAKKVLSFLAIGSMAFVTAIISELNSERVTKKEIHKELKNMQKQGLLTVNEEES